mmetsp:Transcript_35242/g.101352  ORF Transcript_35242/g.101352 Transcript_35242/m.101352 type:complete len:262 (+) Transcript_35242:1778-2563(+)
MLLEASSALEQVAQGLDAAELSHMLSLLLRSSRNVSYGRRRHLIDAEIGLSARGHVDQHRHQISINDGLPVSRGACSHVDRRQARGAVHVCLGRLQQCLDRRHGATLDQRVTISIGASSNQSHQPAGRPTHRQDVMRQQLHQPPAQAHRPHGMSKLILTDLRQDRQRALQHTLVLFRLADVVEQHGHEGGEVGQRVRGLAAMDMDEQPGANAEDGGVAALTQHLQQRLQDAGRQHQLAMRHRSARDVAQGTNRLPTHIVNG